MIPIPKMMPTLQYDMYVDALHPWRSRVDPSNRSFQGVYVAGRTSAVRIVDDNISGNYATATQSKRVEDNLSWVLHSMANANVACNPDFVVHDRATDVAGLRGIGGTTMLEEIGTHPLWDDVFIDRSPLYMYNILSLHQAQVHGFRELISQDQQRKILSNPERGIALVFHKDDKDKFYKLHASKVVKYIRKVYSIGLQDVYCESRVYNAAHFYTLDQQQRAHEAIRLHQAFNHPSDKALSTLLVSPSAINIKFTPMDLQNARAITGKLIIGKLSEFIGILTANCCTAILRPFQRCFWS